MLGELTAVGSREALQRSVLWERLRLVAYAYGTNTGISAVAVGNHGRSEADLRYTARRYFTIDGARAAAIQLADATFAARDPAIWGQSTTTVASDSTLSRVRPEPRPGGGCSRHKPPAGTNGRRNDLAPATHPPWQ